MLFSNNAVPLHLLEFATRNYGIKAVNFKLVRHEIGVPFGSSGSSVSGQRGLQDIIKYHVKCRSSGLTPVIDRNPESRTPSVG